MEGLKANIRSVQQTSTLKTGLILGANFSPFSQFRSRATVFLSVVFPPDPGGYSDSWQVRFFGGKSFFFEAEQALFCVEGKRVRSVGKIFIGARPKRAALFFLFLLCAYCVK